MPPESEFDEVVLFDVPPEHADSLWTRLQHNRLAWLLRTEDGLFVAAALRIEPDDLAQLLRDVQSWIADHDLLYVRFLLDGRDYALEAPAEALAGKSA
jgi:hypothetical protein